MNGTRAEEACQARRKSPRHAQAKLITIDDIALAGRLHVARKIDEYLSQGISPLSPGATLAVVVDLETAGSPAMDPERSVRAAPTRR